MDGLIADGGPGATVGAKPAAGNEASSVHLKQAATTTTIPISNVFARLLQDIPAQGATTTILSPAEYSIDAVDQVLQQLQLEPPGGSLAQAVAPAHLPVSMQQATEPTSPTVNTQAASFQALFAGLNVQNPNASETAPLADSASPPMEEKITTGVVEFFASVTTPTIQSNPSPLKAPAAVQQRRRHRR